MTTPESSRRRWYDREPVKVWLPISAVAAATIQTTAYLNYKLFYARFNVRPEEVGYDYTSVLPRTTIQVAGFLLLLLMFLSAASVVVALIAADRLTDARETTSEVRNRGLGVLALALCLIVACVLWLLDVGVIAFWTAMVLGAVYVIVEHRLPFTAEAGPNLSWWGPLCWCEGLPGR